MAMLSFFVAANQPTRTREESRRFLKRWLGGTILAQQYWCADEFGRGPSNIGIQLRVFKVPSRGVGCLGSATLQAQVFAPYR